MNSKGHFYVSLAKSTIRLIGCSATLATQSIVPMAVMFFIGECLGVVEELVDFR